MTAHILIIYEDPRIPRDQSIDNQVLAHYTLEDDAAVPEQIMEDLKMLRLNLRKVPA